MSDWTNSAVPNPDVYLNHLPPDEAKQFEIARSVYLIVLGAITWDILSYIPEDIRTIKQSKGFSGRTCFILARIFALTYVVLWTTVTTTPVSNCDGLTFASTSLCVLTMAATAFLFLRRVQAVYPTNRLVRWLFGFLWAGCCGVPVAVIPGTSARHIPGTRYCVVYKAASYASLSDFMPAVFDTFVFIAASYKLAFQTNQVLAAPQKDWTTSWFSTKGLPQLQRAMIEGGQQYYLLALILQLGGGIALLSNSVPPTLRLICVVPSAAFSACVACRAHRTMVDAFYWGGLREERTIPVTSTINFASEDISGSSIRRWRSVASTTRSSL